jgi:hypothetical protein
MHIASAISILDEEIPRPKSGNNKNASVKEKQVRRATGEWIPTRTRRVLPKTSPVESNPLFAEASKRPAVLPE